MIALALTVAMVLNPAVSQATIHQTICLHGWSEAQRPPSWWTSRVKRKLLPPGASMRGYVLDHVEPISLGGAPKSTANLQLQTKAEAKAKDRLEDQLHRAVCAGRVSLKDAQQRISAWRP